MMGAAYDAGVNFFDNAEVYAGGKSETVMGGALKELKWDRGSYLISTKLYWGINEGVNQKNTLNRKYLIEGITGSLERLQLDYVDLIYCHRPDKTTPIEETVWAMHNIIEWDRPYIGELRNGRLLKSLKQFRSPNDTICTSLLWNSHNTTCLSRDE